MAGLPDSSPLLQDSEEIAFTVFGTETITSSDIDILPRVISSASIKEESSNAKKLTTFRKLLKDETNLSVNINLLVIGRTGQGKSALTNSIIEQEEEIAKEGSRTNISTKTCQSYVYPDIVPGVNLTLTDTQGLQDANGKGQAYIQEMKKESPEVSLILYCMKMTDHRLINDDKVAIQKLHQTFGPKFWERVVIVLTFANDENCRRRDSRDEDAKGQEPSRRDKEAWKMLKRERFIHRVELRKQDINEFVKQQLGIDEDIPVIPAGCYKQDSDDDDRDPKLLPDQENWLHNLLHFCYNRIKTKFLFSRLQLNNKIHIAIIIDNCGEVMPEEDGKKKLSSEAETLKNVFEGLEFCVLYFYSLSSQSIETLLQSLQEHVLSQLSMFALVFLSKGVTPQLYDANKMVVPFRNVFRFFNNPAIPKIFIFDSVCPIDVVKDDYECCDTRSLQNSLTLVIAHDDQSFQPIISIIAESFSHTNIKKCFEDVCKQGSELHGVKCKCYSNCDNDIFIGKSINEKSKLHQKQLEILRPLWYPVRCETINTIIKITDEVMSVVRNERIAKIIISSASLLVGVGAGTAGLVISPLTGGTSAVAGLAIGISIASGMTAVTTFVSSIGASQISKILSNKKLEKAQEHISLDQQLSLSINSIDMKIRESEKNLASLAAVGVQSIGNVSRFGLGVTTSIESAAKIGASVAHTATRTTGLVLGAVSLAVTVPIDIGFIVYHSIQIHKANTDKTGKTDSNSVIRWLSDETDELLKGTCNTIDKVTYSLGSGMSFDSNYGYQIIAPISQHYDGLSVTVRTIFSGPMKFPEGFTLVSAVYDVKMDKEKLEEPLTLRVDHCVDISDRLVAEKMFFAIHTSTDIKNKVLVFTQVNDGAFNIGDNYGSIKCNGRCFLCILYNGSLQDTAMKYAAQYCYTPEYKNFWSLKIIFTKYLKAHFKYIQSDHQDQFEFESNDELHLDLDPIKDIIKIHVNGWEISSSNEDNPAKVTKKEIDCVESQEETWKSLKMKFPFVSLHVYIRDNETAANELNETFRIKGANLKITIQCSKT